MRNYKPTIKFTRIFNNNFAVSEVLRGRYVPGEKIKATPDAIDCTLTELLELIDWLNASPRDRQVLGIPEPRIYRFLKNVRDFSIDPIR